MSKVHAHQESADLRELDASGGWYRTENDLQIFFCRIVGFKACWLYEVLCRLIPLAQKRLAEGERLDLTQDFMAQQSGISKSQVQRELETLVAVGMVRKFQPSNKRCATYQLVRLQKLRDLGVETLTSRLGNPVRVSDAEGDDSDRREEALDDTPQSGVDSDDLHEDGESMPPGAVEASTRSAQSGNPDRVTGIEGGDGPGLDSPCTDSGSPVTQNPGVGDPGEGLLIKDKNIRQKDSPVVPVPGTVADPVLSFVDCRHGDPKFEVNLRDAARWVMEQDGITAGVSQTRRLEGVIAEALRLEAKQSRRELVELARLAAANWLEYRSTKGKFALKIENFMAQMVFRREKWGVRPAASSSSSASVGVNTETVEQAAEKDLQLRRAVQGYLEGNSVAIALAGHATFAARLDGLQAQAASSDLVVIDQALQHIEEELVEALKVATSPEDLALIEADADKSLAPYRGRMQAIQILQVREQWIYKRLIEAAKLPRLSLFYMKHGG